MCHRHDNSPRDAVFLPPRFRCASVMPNSFAFVALFGWPLVVWLLFRALPVSHAVVWSVVGGYLLLPHGAGVDFVSFPTLDKTLIPAVSAAVLALMARGQTLRAPRRMPAATAGQAQRSGPAFTRQSVQRFRRGSPDTLAAEAVGVDAVGEEAAVRPQPLSRLLGVPMILLVLTPFLTVATNRDGLLVGSTLFAGLTAYDGFSLLQGNLVMVLPFLLGLFCLGAPQDHPVLLRILAVGGLLYSVPTLLEIRLSPQISTWVYGYLSQSFAQAMRDGGFRPVVFLQHGLWLAIFLAMAALAALALWRHERAAGRGGGWALACGLWLGFVLALCHSLGALIILLALAPVVMIGSARVQMLLAFAIVIVMLTYPTLRGAGLVPTQSFENMAAAISLDRAGSLQFRLDNEDRLLARANQRGLAGWGGYARARVYDPETGRDISVTDGTWIIVLGGSGWLGYAAVFGLMGVPVILLFWRRRQLDPSLGTAGLCLLLSANLIDMIPNATLTPVTWLIAGALAGRCRYAVAQAPQPVAAAPSRRRYHRTAAAVAMALVLSGIHAERSPAMADTASLAVPVAATAGTGLTNPSLALDVAGVTDWSTEMPFLDLMKTARPWIGHSSAAWSAMTYEDLLAGGHLDAQGWPKDIPAGLSAVGTVWDWNPKDTLAATSRKGVYVLTYTGEGTIELGGDAPVLRNRPGRILFRNQSGGSILLSISVTDPRHTGNPVRNIAIVPERYEDLHAAGEVFNPAWLAVVQDMRVLRFMDWMKTNWAIGARWADRPHPDDATWAARGVPLEVMVQLANQIGIEPWFAIPAGADDAYIRSFATYVRNHLNPKLQVHVEYSNETWNWVLGQTQWLGAQAKAAWASSDGAAWLDYDAMLATRSAVIWRQVFGAQAAARLDTVLGTQTANPWIASRLLTAPLWQSMDPAGYVAPSTVFTSLAVTTYFGGATMANEPLRTQLLTMLATPGADVSSWLTARLMDPSYDQSIPVIAGWLKSNRDVARQYGLKLLAYEGGQHLLQGFGISGMTEQDQATLTTFLSAYVRSPAMADLYDILWTTWGGLGDGPFMQFTDVDQASKWGAWGLYAALGDHTPRADQLMDLNARTPAWFAAGGPQFQQGVIWLARSTGETVAGTARDDFLIGGAGDDSFVPGTGHDTVSGGAGLDAISLPGVPADYRLVPERTGYRLTGPNLDDFVLGVERFDFAGGSSKTLTEMLNG